METMYQKIKRRIGCLSMIVSVILMVVGLMVMLENDRRPDPTSYHEIKKLELKSINKVLDSRVKSRSDQR